jgi:hypothetical protein
MANEFIARNGLIALDNSRITGSLNISGSLSVNNTPAVLGSGTTNRILKLTASSTAGDSLIFDNGTNVLIGTTTTPTPVVGVAFPLTVTSANTTRIRIDSTQATPNSGFGLYANSVQKWSIAMFGATSDFTIYNDALLASAILVKGGSSNVLIGTPTDAGFKLDVNGTGRFSGALITTAGNGIIVGGTSFAFNPTSVRGSLHIAGSDDRVLSFGTNGNQNAYIYSSSSLTQLVSTPELRFAVGGLTRLTIASTGAATFSSSVTFTHGGGYTTRIEPNNQINTFFNSSGTAMYLNFQGNGGIFAGSSYAVLYAGSDERIKSEIKESEKTLDKVLNLKPRTFRYKERPENLYYGFIAQEVEKIIPEIVRTDDGINIYGKETIENQKSIESYGLVWASILVKAIQEQQTQIEELKSLIK